MFKQIMDGLEAEMDNIRRRSSWWVANCDKYTDLMGKLGPLKPEYAISTGLEITINGTKEQLNKMFHALRSEGYKPMRLPEENTSYYCTYWTKSQEDEKHDEIWVVFCSTVCRRVQVGTEMKEVPVYEVRCTE